ncbi:Lipase 3 N-terminal region [Musa troglodytarum]|uniref:Lipase 3 N-terminal region n=1 Tax=Musa troglodytarum TaxID=320322 RepID=A0A9E7IM89_9LILI|nr:Lipase 3 N-terminal region [Musa troglodytarum]
MATATVATAAAMAVVLYFLLSRRIAATRTDGEEDHGGGGSVHKVERVAAGRRRIARRPAQPPATWREAVATLVETLRFTYSETLGKWPIGDLAFGIKYLMRRQFNVACNLRRPFPIFLESAGYSPEDVLLQDPKAGLLKPAFTILDDKETKCFLLLIRGTHSIKDTLTAATGAVVPFHHSILDEGGVKKLVLGYAHCGMVAAARWIAKCTTPCLLKAVNQHPDYKIKIVGHSLGGGTAALLTYILRERKEFFSGTCVAFAPAACMTWELAESGKDFITTIVNGSDLVPTFSTASIDDLRSEVMASSWLNDLRDQIQRTRILNVIYRSASALGSHLPSISSARAKVAGAGALLQPVSSKTQVMVKHAQYVAQAVARSQSSFSSWTCMGARRRAVGTVTKEKEPILPPAPQRNSEKISVDYCDNEMVNEPQFDSSKDSDNEETEEEELIQQDQVGGASAVDQLTDADLWFQLEKEINEQSNSTVGDGQEEVVAAVKKIMDEENAVLQADKQQISAVAFETHQFYPPGRIMHMVVLQTTESDPTENVIMDEKNVGIYESPRYLYKSMASQYPVLNNRPIDQWKVTELKEELRRRKIPVRGLKEELVRKLFEAIRTEEMIKEQETGDQVQSDCPDPTLDGDGDQKQAENSAADHTNIVPDPIGQSHSDASAIDINCSDTIPDPVGKTDCDATITDIDINREIKVQNATTATSALDVTVLETQANTVLLEDSATESQTVITQCESRVMVSRTEEKHEEEKQEDSNVPDEDIKPSLSDLDNQVSVVSPDLGFQVKCESIPIDSVSIVEKNKLKDNLNADDFHLEQELVKPEMVQPSSSSVPSVGGDLQSLGDDKDLQSLDDDKDLKSSGDDKEQAKHLVSLEDTYVKSSTNFNLSKEDNIDEGSPEKLNLDRCSSDELMEEDVLEGKQIDPNMKSEDVAEKSEVKQEPAVGARTNIKDGLLESIPDKKDTVDEDHRKQEGSTEREN